MNYAVILAGGRGERFWPLSRSGHPKQLLHITSERTMLQETIDRIVELIPVNRTVVVTGEVFEPAILKNIHYLKEKNILTEPEGKNTCLAIALSAVHLQKVDPEAVMVVLSSDHLIKPESKLREILKLGGEIAKNGECLITVGIVPTRAETAYGYIEMGELFSSEGAISVFRVKQFKEKPSRMIAQEYYYDRKHLWNSGIFIWNTKIFLDSIQKYMPQMYTQLVDYSKLIDTSKKEQAKRKLYAEAENISVDCAVLEKATNVLTIKADLIWDDVGSWLALDRIKEKDRENNVVVGEAVLQDTYETTIVNDDKGIITTLGVSDLVIVKTNDIVFVAHKTKVQEVKEIIQKLAENKKLVKYL